MLTTRLLMLLCLTLCCVSAGAIGLKAVKAIRDGRIHWYRGSRQSAANWQTFDRATDPSYYWDGVVWCTVGCLAFLSMAVYMLVQLPAMLQAGL